MPTLNNAQQQVFDALQAVEPANYEQISINLGNTIGKNIALKRLTEMKLIGYVDTTGTQSTLNNGQQADNYNAINHSLSIV